MLRMFFFEVAFDMTVNQINVNVSSQTIEFDGKMNVLNMKKWQFFIW